MSKLGFDCKMYRILPCEVCGGSYGTDPADPTHGYPVCCGKPRKLIEIDMRSVGLVGDWPDEPVIIDGGQS